MDDQELLKTKHNFELRLTAIEEKLDFLIYMQSKNIVGKNAIGEMVHNFVPGEALFENWKKEKNAKCSKKD